jgi:hypothetical protein
LTPDDNLEASRRRLVAEAWAVGNLEYLRHGLQRRIKAQLREALARGARRFVVEAGRKVGKTYGNVIEAHEVCLNNPGGRVVYGAPTLKMLEEFVHPEFARVAAEAPESMRPVWNGHLGHYRFPNGSWVHLFGANDEERAKKGRGPGAVAAIFDEFNFCPVLSTVLDDVFKPSLMLTGGWQLLTSSPADVPEHPGTTITEIEEARGNYAHASWLENPMLSAEQRTAEIAENAAQAGVTVDAYIRSAKYRREYLGERVVDPTLVGVPEWEEARKTQIAVIERPTLFRGQEGIDFGGVDRNFVVFGYWHPGKGIVIEDELVLHNDETTLQLAEAIKAKERALWGVDTWEGTLAGLTVATLTEYFGGQPPSWATQAAGLGRGQPWMRSRDTDTQLGIDLLSHGLLTIPTRKDRKQLAVDALRVLIAKREFWIHPRCVHLDRDLRATTWANDKREQWARRGDGSHGDGVDAAVYLRRNICTDVPIDPTTMRHPLLRETGRGTPLERRLHAARR